jgi:hypothetical protein
LPRCAAPQQVGGRSMMRVARISVWISVPAVHWWLRARRVQMCTNYRADADCSHAMRHCRPLVEIGLMKLAIHWRRDATCMRPPRQTQSHHIERSIHSDHSKCQGTKITVGRIRTYLLRLTIHHPHHAAQLRADPAAFKRATRPRAAQHQL